jgi:hypothetical protein
MMVLSGKIERRDLMKRFFRCSAVTFCYWLLMFIGPAIVLLWNNFSYYFTGAGYGSESLMYRVLTFFSQPISCFLAAGLAGSIFDGKHRLCTLVNCVVGACYCSASALMYLLFVDNSAMLGAMAVSAIACITTAYMQANGLVCTVDSEELERLQTENIKLKESLKDQNDATYVLNMIAKRSGVTTTAMAESLFINFRKAGGCTEEAARAELQKEKQNWPQS